MAGLILFLVFLAGYAVQRGSTCAVAAVEEVVQERRPERLLGFLVSGAVALAVMAVSALLGHDMFNHYRGANAFAPPIFGGVIFGTGAWLNGACAFGTVARLGRGDTARLSTLAGMLIGIAMASRSGIQSPPTDFPSPLLGVPVVAILLVSAAVAALLWSAARRPLPVPRQDGGWHPLRALALIGLINGALLIVAPGWPYTNLLMDLTRSIGPSLAWRSLMCLVFIVGAVVGALTAGLFQPRFGGARRWGRCLAAGILMGVGATLVPGGNDTMLLVGLPLLLPSFVLAYVAMIATMALLIAARFPQTIRPFGLPN